MTDLMQVLFDYVKENLSEYLPGKYFWHHDRVQSLQEEALLETLSERQWELWEALQSAEGTCADLREQALFQAALALARELQCLTPRPF